MIDTVEISHKLQTADLATKADLATLKAELIYWFLGAFLLNAIAQLVAAFMRH